ncbi:MAG: rRNA maturation RNase YbeY [Candidatus Paracaedibacteraceae bacterium]|nr:rRNA maturation RNase YbeY [Candidatus Paracaedibacteraceae bacterium]
MINLELQLSVEDLRWEGLLNEPLETFFKKYIYSALTCSSVLNNMPKHIEVSLLLTNDQNIQELNQEYRGKNKPTNVLSFPQEENISILKNMDTCVLLGDIVLSIETIELESKQQQKLMHHHLSHLIVHSTLHLIGYDHETDEEAEEMESLEIAILQQHNIPNPYESDSAYMV